MDELLQPDFAQRICNALYDETNFPVVITDLDGVVLAFQTDRDEWQQEPLDCYTRPILHRGVPIGFLRFDADPEQVRPMIGIALRMIRMLLEKREQLQAISQKNSEILDHIYDGYYEVDLAGNLVQFNKSLCEIFGYEHEDLCGINYRKLMDTSSARRLAKQFILVYRTQKPRRSVEFEMVRRDGDIKVIDASVVLIVQDGQPVGFRGIIRNATDRKRTEELLRKSEKLSVLGQLAAGVAHEIRNPLTAIKGFVQLLQTTNSTSPHYYEIILSELERINLIVSEFMMLAKPQASLFKQKNLSDLLQSIMALISSQAMIHNVQIVEDYGERAAFVYCEENQLKQVFINIMKNAIEAMPDGGYLAVRILPSGENGVVIRFQDNGCGIPADRIERLGEPFYTTKEKGTGLGMMVSYKIIETHHGKISIESEVGVGTTLDVYLPTAKVLSPVMA